MADYIQLESGADHILLQDGGGAILLQSSSGAAADVFICGLDKIGNGVVAVTAAGVGGVLQE